MIFLSCAPADEELAERLRQRIADREEVFVNFANDSRSDEESRAIASVVTGCYLVAPVVTTASKDSLSLDGETLLAMLYPVMIVSFLFDESLPLPLADSPFIDFRDDFESGMSDLWALLSNSSGEVQRPVPEEGQTSLSPDLRGLLSGLRLRETATLQPKIHPRFYWTLELVGSSETLALINAVTYVVNPSSYLRERQRVRARSANFKMARTGTWRFEVQVLVELNDSSVVTADYRLRLEGESETPLTWNAG